MDSPRAANRGFRYTGLAWIPEIGLYCYRARNYNRRLGEDRLAGERAQSADRRRRSGPAIIHHGVGC